MMSQQLPVVAALWLCYRLPPSQLLTEVLAAMYRSNHWLISSFHDAENQKEQGYKKKIKSSSVLLKLKGLGCSCLLNYQGLVSGWPCFD